MAYGNLLTDVVQSSTTNTPPVFKDGTGKETGQLCRAWVNFGYISSAISVRGSFNISSVTRGATGRYTVNFTNAMPDATYATTIGGWNNGGGNGAWVCVGTGAGSYPTGLSTTAVSITSYNYSGSDQDQDAIFLAVFR